MARVTRKTDSSDDSHPLSAEQFGESFDLPDLNAPFDASAVDPTTHSAFETHAAATPANANSGSSPETPRPTRPRKPRVSKAARSNAAIPEDTGFAAATPAAATGIAATTASTSAGSNSSIGKTATSTGSSIRAAAGRKSGSWTRALFQPGVLALLATVVAGVVCFPYLKGRLPRLEDDPEYLVAASKIRVNEQPKWIPGNLVADVASRGHLPDELSLLERRTAQDVADAFALHPWVLAVTEVRLSHPSSIQVRLKYREPVAMIEVRGGAYPVDEFGFLLPPGDFSASDVRQYLRVTGVRSTPQGSAGTIWGDPVVTSAAKLAALLKNDWPAFGIAEIQAPDATANNDSDRNGFFELVSTGGSRIIWGRGPESDHPGELTAAQKLTRMQRYIADFKSFDSGGRFEFDIRNWREIIRRPLNVRSDDAPFRR